MIAAHGAAGRAQAVARNSFPVHARLIRAAVESIAK
jgi:hypothetical protein